MKKFFKIFFWLAIIAGAFLLSAQETSKEEKKEAYILFGPSMMGISDKFAPEVYKTMWGLRLGFSGEFVENVRANFIIGQHWNNELRENQMKEKGRVTDFDLIVEGNPLPSDVPLRVYAGFMTGITSFFVFG